ncbi:MAG: hypothetical protein KBT03_04610 [Bacteroidales bacterium]|nr:hypothetical protein [Candidatus Scybalousia scybalohippi]
MTIYEFLDITFGDYKEIVIYYGFELFGGGNDGYTKEKSFCKNEYIDDDLGELTISRISFDGSVLRIFGR